MKDIDKRINICNCKWCRALDLSSNDLFYWCDLLNIRIETEEDCKNYERIQSN